MAAAKAVVRVFIIAALGCYARHKNLLDADTARTMSRLNGAVFLPCLLFTVLGKAVKAEQLQNVWLLPIAEVSSSITASDRVSGDRTRKRCAAAGVAAGEMCGSRKGRCNEPPTDRYTILSVIILSQH